MTGTLAHAHAIIHRAIKPANVMLTEDDVGLRLLDFGVSKLAAPPPEVTATAPGLRIGTPAFMAPEQFETPDQVGAPADVYALGATLRVLAGTFEHRGLAELVMRCTRAVPDERPSAREIQRCLEAIALELGYATTVREYLRCMDAAIG